MAEIQAPSKPFIHSQLLSTQINDQRQQFKTNHSATDHTVGTACPLQAKLKALLEYPIVSIIHSQQKGNIMANDTSVTVNGVTYTRSQIESAQEQARQLQRQQSAPGIDFKESTRSVLISGTSSLPTNLVNNRDYLHKQAATIERGFKDIYDNELQDTPSGREALRKLVIQQDQHNAMVTEFNASVDNWQRSGPSEVSQDTSLAEQQRVSKMESEFIFEQVTRQDGVIETHVRRRKAQPSTIIK